MTRTVIVDPYDKGSSLLVPFVTQRMLAFAQDFIQETDGRAFVRGILSRLYAGDPRVRVIAFVKDSMTVVGHGVATIESDGVNAWVFVSQLKADDNVGNALDEALDMAKAWGVQFGATRLQMSTGRNERAWEKRLGFRTVRRVMEVPIAVAATEESDAS